MSRGRLSTMHFDFPNCLAKSTATKRALLEGRCSVARAAAGYHVICRLAPMVVDIPGRAVDKEKAFCPQGAG